MAIKFIKLHIAVFCFFSLFNCHFALAASDQLRLDPEKETYRASGEQQNAEFLKNNIPSGDALLAALTFLANIVERSEDIIPAVNVMRSHTLSLLATSETCQSTESCQPKCECQCANPDDKSTCQCKSIPCEPKNLCEMGKVNESFSGFNEAYAQLANITDTFTDNVIGKHNVTNDIKIFNLATKTGYYDKYILDRSPIIGKYSEFRNNYNNIVVPNFPSLSKIPEPVGIVGSFDTFLKTLLPLPMLDYIKRKTDFTRIQFSNCYTSTLSEGEWEDYMEGNTLYRSAGRTDLLMDMNTEFPDEPTNPLDYYCIEN